MFANLQSEWNRLFVDGLFSAGIRNVILSPGSRSTPLVLALAACESLTLHVAHDERVGAFMALGQARVTGHPSLVVSTSGTAGAHMMPAVMEASASHVPLVILTADRPFELHHVGAPQTIDQLNLFGRHVRDFFEIGAPAPDELALRAVRRIAQQAVFTSMYPRPGAVHMNLRAKKPLEPPREPLDEESQAFADLAEKIRSKPAVLVEAPKSIPSRVSVDRLTTLLAKSQRPVIVTGPVPAIRTEIREAVLRLASAAVVPVFCESTGQARFCSFGAPSAVERDVTHPEVRIDGFSTLLSVPSFRAIFFPDLVLQIGTTPTSSSWASWSSNNESAVRAQVLEHGWFDADRRVDHLFFGPEGELLDAVRGGLAGSAPHRDRWLEFLRQANDLVWRSVEQVLEREGEKLSEGQAVRQAIHQAPEGSVVCLGNSLAVRHVDAFVRCTRQNLDVISQRGVNGIDGLVAGAIGTSRVAKRPVLLILGDISFLHDVSALVSLSSADAPLVIMVLNNRGGRIFEQLPVARLGLDPKTMALFTTPHELSCSSIASAFGHRAQVPETRAALSDALESAFSLPEVTIIEVRVEEDGAHTVESRIRRAIEGEIAGLLAQALEFQEGRGS